MISDEEAQSIDSSFEDESIVCSLQSELEQHAEYLKSPTRMTAVRLELAKNLHTDKQINPDKEKWKYFFETRELGAGGESLHNLVFGSQFQPSEMGATKIIKDVVISPMQNRIREIMSQVVVLLLKRTLIWLVGQGPT